MSAEEQIAILSEALAKTLEALRLTDDHITDDDMRTMLKERKEKIMDAGFKANYGSLTSTADGNKKRAAAVDVGNTYLYSKLGEASRLGQEYLAMRDYFDKAKLDFNWKNDYGKLCSTEEGNKKRREAELKSVKYVGDKFGRSTPSIENWLVPLVPEKNTCTSTLTIASAKDLSENNQITLQKIHIGDLADAGFKHNYGVLTSAEAGNKKRQKALEIADFNFFAQLGRGSVVGEEFVRVTNYFNDSKMDFGWKENYGAMTSTDKANSKRATAEEKAVKYACEQSSRPEDIVKMWLIVHV